VEHRLRNALRRNLGIPGVGVFKDGRADFYDYEPIGGHWVLVRFSIWKIGDDKAQSEQAFSADGARAGRSLGQQV